MVERFVLLRLDTLFKDIQVLALRLQRGLLDFNDLRLRRDGAVNRQRGLIAFRLIFPHQFITANDHLVRIPSQRIADSRLVDKAVQIEHQVLQLAAVRKQPDDLNRRCRLLRRANIRTHQTAENGQRLLLFSKIDVNFTQPKAGLRPEHRVQRGDFQSFNRLLLFLRCSLKNPRTADSKLAATRKLAFGKSFQIVEERLLRFRRFVTQQITETNVEIQ